MTGGISDGEVTMGGAVEDGTGGWTAIKINSLV